MTLVFHEPKLCLLIDLFFSENTPLILSACNGHTDVCRLLLENAADVGTEVELLLVGVPGNCCFGSRLRFDDHLLAPPGASDESSSHSLVRFQCSFTFTFMSCAGDEELLSGCFGVCEVVAVLPVSRSFPSTHSLLGFKNFPFHGQLLIGLLGAGASKGDGPSLDASAPPFVPSLLGIGWPQSDSWISLSSPIPVFSWAYHITVRIDHVPISSSTFSRCLYKRVVFLMNAFRIRWNRRLRRTSTARSRLRQASDQWLRLFDYSRDCSGKTRCTAAAAISTTRALFGRKRLSPRRPTGYLLPHLHTPTVTLQTLISAWFRFRHCICDRRAGLSRPLPAVFRPNAKPINVLLWNVGANINLEPQHSILVESLKTNRVDIACLQEFRNNDILLPLHTLRPVSVWPSLLTRIGSNETPHVFGGSLLASRLGYLTRDATSHLGSIEFNSVCVHRDFHIINAYLPATYSEARGSGSYDDSVFLLHTDALSSRPGSSTLIAGDFNVPLHSLHLDTPRVRTFRKLLDQGFEIMNPVDSDGHYLDTHYSASYRSRSCIDIVLWKGPLGRRHVIHGISVKRLHLNARDHFGLLVSLNAALPRPKRSGPSPSAFKAFADCIGSAPPPSSPAVVLTDDALDCETALTLWASIQKGTVLFTEAHVSDLVSTWLKSKQKRSDPLIAEYLSVCSSLIETRERLSKTSSYPLFKTLCAQHRDFLTSYRHLRRDITLRSRCEQTSRLAREAILSGKDSHIRRFLVNTMNPPGNCLDLSALSSSDFKRFRSYYSECWDPPDLPPLDLSFLDQHAPPVSVITSAVTLDITEPCTEDEIVKAVKSLANGKAPGPSRLPVDFYKIALNEPEVISFLLLQVNECLAGNRPACLDDCRLVLIFKKGDRADPSNWRPINLTNAAFRVCEKVIYHRLAEWSERVLGPNAFGFRSGRRAEDVCFLLANRLHRFSRSRRPVHLISLDISKAFDTVPHDQLLISLLRAGLSKASVRVIASMLTGHTCTVGDPANPHRHFVIRIKRGVLQGGILSPLLFNIFFDQSLHTSIPGILPLSYADDVTGLHVGPDSPVEHSVSSIQHHESIYQQRLAARAQSAASLDDGDDEIDDSLGMSINRRRLLIEGDIPTPSSILNQICRDQVNSWLRERDEWLASRDMRHNANKSEALVLRCAPEGVPPIQLPSGIIPVRSSVTVLGMQPHFSGFCDRAGASSTGARAAQLFLSAWQKLRSFVTFQELRSLLMAFVYSHSVFGSCLQRFSPGPRTSPMTKCIRSVVGAHPTVNCTSLYEFMGLLLPSMRVLLLRLGFLLRCMDPTSPSLLRSEFLHHRVNSPWFTACLTSLRKLPQPKSGLSLCERFSTCIEVLQAPAYDLPATFSHPPPDDLNAVLVTDGSAVVDEHSCAGPAGWGYILFHNGFTYKVCGSIGLSTSDNAEAMALFYGLQHCVRLQAPFIHIRTDNLSCKELLEGHAFPEGVGCLRLYLLLMTIDSQIFPYKVYSHSAFPHRDILNDVADELASLGRDGRFMNEVSHTTAEHRSFLQLPIPRQNPGREGEEPPAPSTPETSHSNAIDSFKRTVRSSVQISQMMLHKQSVGCNFRWLNFPGSPPAIVKAPIMRQHFLYHLRYDLQSHFLRHPALNHLSSNCPLCGSISNSNIHRVFECSASSSHVSLQDSLSWSAHRRSLRAFRDCYTSLLPLDDNHLEYPRTDSDYLFWLGSSKLLIVNSSLQVRALNDDEMKSLAEASYGLHTIYVKYSIVITPPPAPLHPTASTRPPFKTRSADRSDCATISLRLTQCRLYDEIAGWYLWHGYAPSTVWFIMQRAEYNGIAASVLMSMYMKIEVLLSACLCAFPSARQLILSRHGNSQRFNLTDKVYRLFREGNPLMVPVSEGVSVSKRPTSRHSDMPAFFYDLPFHYLNSSPLVEAWFAADSAAERRSLIAWPTHADVAKTIRCPIWKLFTFEELPEELYKPTGSSCARVPRATLHPQITLIYELLTFAIQRGNVRVTWRVRYQHLLDITPSPSKNLELRRRLIFSLIFGDVRNVDNYNPPGTLLRRPYMFTSTAQDVTCVPLCYQEHKIRGLPGFSLPVRGPAPHPPKRSFFLGVKMQIDDYRLAFSRAESAPDLEPLARRTAMTDAATATANTDDAATAAAIKAMADSAETWARELINSTRDPGGPASHEFPILECPALPSPVAADAALPSGRPHFQFSDDEGASDDDRHPAPDDD